MEASWGNKRPDGETDGRRCGCAVSDVSQVPDTIKFEAETLTNMAYDMSNTPRISFETLKGIGKASGTASASCLWERTWRWKITARLSVSSCNGG